jgi:transposase
MTAAAMPVTDQQRAELARMASSTSLPHRQVVQARGLLWACAGVANEEIARRCGVDSDTVRRWRSRFAEKGVAGVGRIAKGRGRKPSLPPGTVEEVLRVTHKERPADGSTQWSTRTLAARVGIGKDAVAKIWADHNLKPWKVDAFKVSNDPRFEEKLVDVVGLYPSGHSAVFTHRALVHSRPAPRAVHRLEGISRYTGLWFVGIGQASGDELGGDGLAAPLSVEIRTDAGPSSAVQCLFSGGPYTV